MNGLDKLEEIKNGLIGHCKSSYLKDQPNNELEKTIMVYEGMFNAIEKELKVLQLIKEKEVDIGCLKDCIKCSKTKSVKSIMGDYNYDQDYWKLENYLNMKQTQLLVEWLKEE